MLGFGISDKKYGYFIEFSATPDLKMIKENGFFCQKIS